ncbi:serine hydrolase [Segetibacter aerophilus]|uniref:Serine hydrolase n=1 Tax=Segetibacter aerophilus TaxID=670293 RepID=A0A512B6S3_9BACT|nr:serine hydrolase [Segetibacter aerophilus]GEO07664.1 serine hydrolase [Segetibacter aerophilus]
MQKYFIVTCLWLFCIGTLNAQKRTPSFVSDSLDSYINQGLKDWNIPGLSIAIVKDGKTVVMKGFGVRDIETKEPVDENTLFMIASNSKLFTGTALSQLEYNKKISIDDKVSKYIKGYSLYDKNTTDLVTIRDLLSHRLGTKTFQGDFVFWNSNLGRQQIINKMKLLQPTGIFRQSYGYCNSCFVTAGEVIPVVTGKPWEVYIYDSLIVPLGMTNTHTLGNGIGQRANASKPYTTSFTGKLTLLPYDNVDNLGPAGSIVSNVKDLSHWLLMQLDSGRYEGKRVLQWPVVRRTREINTITRSLPSAVYPIHFQGYGLGVFMADYNGKQIYFHTGGADGFVTNTCFVPEENLGITILTNNDNQNFFEALRYQILDAYLGVKYINRSKALLNGFTEELDDAVKTTNALKARVQGKKPPLDLTAYVGTYENELYGPVTIETDTQGKGLSIDFKGHTNLKATLDYMDKDEFLLTYNNLGFGLFGVKFKTVNKKVVSIELRVNEFIDYDAYNFTKK